MRKLTAIATLMMAACTCFGAGGHKVALVLPFNVARGGAVNYMDFYCGAFLAADSLTRSGMDITIKVIDCMQGTDSTKGTISKDESAKVINSKDASSKSEISKDESANGVNSGSGSYADASFEGVSLIIGPVTPEQQEKFQSVSIEGQIPIVSPLDSQNEKFAGANPYFFSVPASRRTQINNMVNSIIGDGDGDIVIFYNKNTGSDLVYDEKIEKALLKAGVKFSRRSYNIQQGRVITEQLKNEMADGHKKKVVIASEDEAFASDVVRNMALLELDGTKLSLYGSVKLRNFDTIDAATLYKLDFHFFTPFFVDYKDEATRNFVKNYRELFNTEPTPYAFQGYDILFYFVSMMDELGESFMDFVTYYPKSLLQNNFRFERIDEDSGLVNTGTRDVRYLQDHSVEISTEL